MIKRFLFLTLLTTLLSSCAHHDLLLRREALKQEAAARVIADAHYNNLKNEIIVADAVHLRECNCMAAFQRDLFAEPDNSARYVFDAAVSEEALKVSKNNDTVSVLVFGSGLLLNELSALTTILAHKKNVKIYINDWAYIFYGDDNFAEKAIAMGKDPASLPEGYKQFYFWEWARKKNKDWPFIPFFEMHHAAIDEFKKVIAGLDRIYGTTSTVDVIKPPKDEPVNLPPIDMIISVDAFTDVPNLVHMLHYQYKLDKNPVRFVALNKLRPMGNFWHPNFNNKIEDIDKKPLSLDIYDVWSENGRGKYQRIRHAELSPSPRQVEKQLDFKHNLGRDWTQSPLDVR